MTSKMMRNFLLSFSIVTSLSLLPSCVSTTQNTKPRAAELKMEIGVSHMQRNNLPLALKELLGALELDPKNPYVHNNLGIVYYLREKYDLSAKYFAEAVTLNPAFTEAKNNLARVYIEQKQYSKAARLLDEVLADLTYTNAHSAYFNFGLLYFNQNKFDQAKLYLSKILSDNREDCYTQVYYARSLMETNHTKLAAEQLDKATQFCHLERVDDAHFYGAIAYYRSGNKQKALARFEELVKIFPDGKHRAKSTEMIQLIQKEMR
jgi:type IV pilus assembly protein PilF